MIALKFAVVAAISNEITLLRLRFVLWFEKPDGSCPDSDGLS